MEGVFLEILNFLFVSVVIYFSIAMLFILLGKRKKPVLDKGNLAFDELFIDYT